MSSWQLGNLTSFQSVPPLLMFYLLLLIFIITFQKVEVVTIQTRPNPPKLCHSRQIDR